MKVLVFSQENCSGCRALEKYLENEYQEQKEEISHIDIQKDSDSLKKFNITATPTIVLLDEDNDEVIRHIGFNFENDDDEVIDEIMTML